MPVDFSFLLFITGSTGSGEILVIFLIILVMFGPRKLPEVARTIGRVLAELRRASQDFKDQIMAIDVDEVKAPPIKNDWDERLTPSETMPRGDSPMTDCPEDAARFATESASDARDDACVLVDKQDAAPCNTQDDTEARAPQAESQDDSTRKPENDGTRES